MPASRIEDQSLPWGLCVSPSPGAVGITPTPESSSHTLEHHCSFVWDQFPRPCARLVSGQRIAPPRGCWWRPPRIAPERPTASPSPAADDGQSVRRHRRGHDTAHGAGTAGHTTPATPRLSVGPWPYDTTVATLPTPTRHTPPVRGAGALPSPAPSG